MIEHVRSARTNRREHRLAHVTSELGETFVQRAFVIAQIAHIRERPIAVPTSVQRPIAGGRIRRSLGVRSSVVLQLFGILERFGTTVALEITLLRMDQHMRVGQTRPDGRFEIAPVAAVQLHVQLVLAPQMRVQCVPRAERCVVGRRGRRGRRRCVVAFRTDELAVDSVTTLVIC